MEENANKINLEKRGKAIIRAGIIGILANLVLASFKVLIGFLSKSISIVLDGVNNLTDALSSVLTIVGMKLSEKPADRDHPQAFCMTKQQWFGREKRRQSKGSALQTAGFVA